jgi:hypothetical protein
MGTRRRRRRKARPESFRRGGGLRRLPELLGQVLDPAARRRGLAAARLVADWAMIVGPHLAARCQPIRLSGGRDGPGVLTIHVGGAAALELQHGEPQVVERINEFFGYPAVARLRLIQAPLPRPVKAPPRWPTRPLAAAEVEALAATVEPVDDVGLRAALASLGRTVKAQLAAPERRSPAAG